MKLKLALLIIFVLFVTSCAKPNAADTETVGDGLRIVASFYPVYVQLLNITKDTDAQLTLLAPPYTGCLHDYQFTPQDMSRITDADVLVLNGGGIEAFTDKLADMRTGLQIIDSSAGLILLADDLHDTEKNAHVWLRPKLAAAQVLAIAAQLAELDADNAETYIKNSNTYIVELERLDTELAQVLQECGNKPVITFHEAFAYWQELGLNVVAVITSEPDTPASAAQLAATVEIAREKGVAALFAEPNQSNDAAGVISRETGISLYTLDPLYSPSEVANLNDPNTYLTGMRANFDVLRTALQERAQE